MDVEAILAEFDRQLDACREGRPVDTGQLRGLIGDAGPGTVAPRHRSRTAATPPPAPLEDFVGRLVVVADLLDAGDADGAVVAFRRGLHQSMRGTDPADLRRN